MADIHLKALSLEMQENDAGAETIADYLRKLLRTLIIEEEGFSGKRPFGNSGWICELHYPLIKAGYIKGKIYENEEYAECESYDEAAEFILEMIDEIYESALNYSDLRD